MSDDDEVSGRLRARMAYLGIRDRTPTADLLPTRSMPFTLTLPDCRDVAAFLVGLVRGTYARCRKDQREAATRRPDHYGDRPLAHWDGGYDWSGRYHAPIWARIAAAALERGLDVADYVERQFARAAEAGTPYPNKLLSPAALDRYDREHRGAIVHQGRVSRGVMEDQLARHISREMTLFGRPTHKDAALCALRDPTNGLRPFFRYWVIARFDHGVGPYREIRATCRRPALLRYAASVRAHDAAYDHPVLAEFRSVVALTSQAFAGLIEDDRGRWVPAPDEAGGHGPAGDGP